MMRQTALDAYSRTSSVSDALRKRLIDGLNDPVPANRLMGMPAVECILGRDLEFTEFSPYDQPENRRAKIDALIMAP